ncbi:MAG: hypothetical protein M3Y85_05860, partial [Bacteroidota bacterium]|nr:hypothetical protein [Bacteroidota bacterium]
MKKGLFAKLLPHLIAVVIFLVVAAIYCKPVLEGKVLGQHDITQWKAMAQNSFKYKETHGHFPLWTNGMFSGMPAYQIAMEGNNVITPGWFYYVLTLGLPKPLSFFFLSCICFYILSQILRINPYVGIITALAYAYATYNPIIVAAGHETKIQSIALMPLLLGTVIWIYERKYWLGGAATAVATALLVGMNHLQITYYTFLILGFLTVGYVIYWIKQKQAKQLLISLAVAAGAIALGVLVNAVNLFTTYEYSKATIRGGTELANEKSNSTKDGLSKDYAFSYSMYKTEPFVMMVPKMFGGSSDLEVPEEDSKAVAALQQMPQNVGQQVMGVAQQTGSGLGSYWGGIGGTSGPPYVGAVICFLTLIGFFILDGKHKWWILAASALAIVMSWGSYFDGFNSFLLNYLPFYNKFRAPSMMIVIPTLLFCVMAALTMQKIILFDSKEELWQRYKKGLLLTAGVFVLLFIIYLGSDYMNEGDRNLLKQTSTAPNEMKEYIRAFLNGLKEDRKGLFLSSLIRSLLFVAAAAAIVWLLVKKNLPKMILIGGLGVLAFIDVMAIDTRYLNDEKYQDENDYQANFTPTPADEQILQDTSYYRVFDLRQGISAALGSGYALPSYFHKSIGGYHPAKLSIYQDLIEQQLSKFPQSLPVVNMLNTKYIIQKDQQGKDQVFNNPDALGAAWFVKGIRYESTPQAVMNALSSFNPKDTAVLFTADQKQIGATSIAADSTGFIRLLKNDNDVIDYQSSSSTTGFAVFSEVFYEKGWKAYIDGKESPIIRTYYV